MNIAELIEKLRQFPQELEVHVMAHLDSDLVDIASVHLITKPFTDEPFVVIEVERSGEPQHPEDTEDAAPEDGDSPPTSTH
jgi:hypothetical protein